MNPIKEAIDGKTKLVHEARAIINKVETDKRDITPEEQKQYDSLLNQIDKAQIRIDNLYKEAGITPGKEALDIVMGNGHRTTIPNKDGITFYSRDNLKELLSKPGQSKQPVSLGKSVRAIITGDYSKLNREERDAIGVGSGGGNYLISMELGKQLIVEALEKTQVINAGARYVPMSENDLMIPKLTQLPSTEFKAENETYSGDKTVNFGGVYLESHTLVSMATMSVELAEDGHKVDDFITFALSKAVAQAIDKACLTGSGIGESPTGIIKQDNILVEDLENTDISSYDFLSNAYYKIEAENITPTALIAPSSVFASLDLLKDKNDNPLRAPASYEKLRKFSSNQLTSANSVMGDFSNLLIGMRTRARLETTREAGDTFEKLQVSFRIYTRFDCALAIPQAFCHIKNIGEVSS